MPREKKQSKAKKFRASYDSDLISQTESEHSNTSEPSSPKKKHRKSKQPAAQGSTPEAPGPQELGPPRPLVTSHISAANPFDDTPIPVPRPNPPGFMPRRMNPRGGMNAAQYPNMNSSFPQPPGGVGGFMAPGGMGGGMGVGGGGGGGGGYHPPPQGVPPPMPPNGPPLHMYGMMNNPPRGPMVFHCGICRQEVQDAEDAILCKSGCNMWFHRMCTGLTEAAYSLLTREHLAEWACDRCIKDKKIPLVRMKPQHVM